MVSNTGVFLYIRRLKSVEATRGQTEHTKEEEMESRRMAESLGWVGGN